MANVEKRLIFSYKVRDPANRKQEKIIPITIKIVGINERMETFLQRLFEVLVNKTKECFEEDYVIYDVGFSIQNKEE